MSVIPQNIMLNMSPVSNTADPYSMAWEALETAKRLNIKVNLQLPGADFIFDPQYTSEGEVFSISENIRKAIQNYQYLTSTMQRLK